VTKYKSGQKAWLWCTL